MISPYIHHGSVNANEAKLRTELSRVEPMATNENEERSGDEGVTEVEMRITGRH